MAISEGGNIQTVDNKELHEQLVGIKGTSRKSRHMPTSHWAAFQIPVLVFIFTKTVLYYTPFTTDTKTIIDIIVVIGIVAGLNIYFHRLNKEKNHG